VSIKEDQEEVQNIKEMVEQAAKAPPCKSKRMIKRKDFFPHRSKERRNQGKHGLVNENSCNSKEK
jgi:hypothetical protein